MTVKSYEELVRMAVSDGDNIDFSNNSVVGALEMAEELTSPSYATKNFAIPDTLPILETSDLDFEDCLDSLPNTEIASTLNVASSGRFAFNPQVPMEEFSSLQFTSPNSMQSYQLPMTSMQTEKFSTKMNLELPLIKDIEVNPQMSLLGQQESTEYNGMNIVTDMSAVGIPPIITAKVPVKLELPITKHIEINPQISLLGQQEPTGYNGMGPISIVTDMSSVGIPPIIPANAPNNLQHLPMTPTNLQTEEILRENVSPGYGYLSNVSTASTIKSVPEKAPVNLLQNVRFNSDVHDYSHLSLKTRNRLLQELDETLSRCSTVSTSSSVEPTYQLVDPKYESISPITTMDQYLSEVPVPSDLQDHNSTNIPLKEASSTPVHPANIQAQETAKPISHVDAVCQAIANNQNSAGLQYVENRDQATGFGNIGKCKKVAGSRRAPYIRHEGPKRIRTTYSAKQLTKLNEIFKTTAYLERNVRIQISEELNLDEQRIKVWFQNRRMKCKKDGIRLVNIKAENKYSDSSSVSTLSPASSNPTSPPISQSPAFPNMSSEMIRLLEWNYMAQQHHNTQAQYDYPYRDQVNNYNNVQEQPYLAHQQNNMALAQQGPQMYHTSANICPTGNNMVTPNGGIAYTAGSPHSAFGNTIPSGNMVPLNGNMNFPGRPQNQTFRNMVPVGNNMDNMVSLNGSSVYSSGNPYNSVYGNTHSSVGNNANGNIGYVSRSPPNAEFGNNNIMTQKGSFGFVNESTPNPGTTSTNVSSFNSILSKQSNNISSLQVFN